MNAATVLCLLGMAVLCLCDGPRQMHSEVFDYLSEMEDKPEGSAAVILFNAHPKFFGKCERCLELHTYFTAFVPAAHEAATARRRRIDFINVEYSPSTEKLIKERSIQVPSLFMVKSGSSDVLKFTGEPSRTNVFDPPGELSVKEQRAARRKSASLTHQEVDELIGVSGKALSATSLAQWVKTETGLSVDVSKVTVAKKSEAEVAQGDGVTIQQVLLLTVGLGSGALFVWRTLTREAPSDEEDIVQNILRVQSSTLLLVAHVFVMGGMHWCILNDAAPMGPNGHLFMSGRARGQFFFEGIFISVVVFAGSYAALSLHRAHQMGSSAQGGPRDVLKFALTVFGFMHLLMVMCTLHKNYWYLSDTWFRKIALGFVTAQKK